MTADLAQTLEALGSDKIVGDAARDTYRNLKKTVRAKLAVWKPGGKPSADELIWVRADGRHYRGRFIEVKEGRLHVESEKFGKGSLALEELSPGSLAFVKQLAGVRANPKREQSERVIQAWTSSDGKVLRARFVRLEDGELTVETAAGNPYTFPLKRLDRESQAKAKRLAADGG